MAMSYPGNESGVNVISGVSLYCVVCSCDLTGHLFYTLEDGNYCEACYEDSLECCAVCGIKIKGMCAIP